MEALLKFLNITQREALAITYAAPMFFLYWKFLNAFVIKNFVSLFEEREALTIGAHSSSEETVAEAKRLIAQTEAKLHAARIEANNERTAEVNAAKDSAIKLVQEAEKEASDHVHKARANLDTELKILNANINQTVQQLATELAAKLQKGASSTILSIFVAALIATTSMTAFAEEAHGGHHGHGTPSDLIPYAVNFFIFVSLLIYFTKAPITAAWANRLQSIKNDVAKGRLEIEEAQKALAHAKARAQSVETEVERIKFEIKKGAKTETQDILKDGHDRALRVRQQGQSLADGDLNHTREEYRANLSRMVIKKATELLEEQITATSDVSLRKNALKQFETTATQIIQ